MLPMIKPTRGRPRTPQRDHQRKRSVTLSDAMVKLGKAIGAGNLSEGLRIALSAYKGETHDQGTRGKT